MLSAYCVFVVWGRRCAAKNVFVICSQCHAMANVGDTGPEFPSWCIENEAPLTQAEIGGVFDELGVRLGFQPDSVANMLDFFMYQLDSRSSRMLCPQALLSLHADYVGGLNANYRKWFFATQYKHELKHNATHEEGAEFLWKTRLSHLSTRQYVCDIALYLLIWGEANNVRYMPECVCFIYHCANSYIEGCESTSSLQFLDEVITPIYNYAATQSVKSTREIDHARIVGYDDINQLFCHRQGLQRIVLDDGSHLMGVEPADRILHFKRVNWSKTFRKTYKERRTWLHVITNFNRIWIIHITMFWYYTSFNSPTLYTKHYVQLLDNQPPLQVTWTVVALGGTIACTIQLFATIFECALFGTMLHNGCKKMIKLCATFILLAVNAAPSVYILWFIPINVYSRSGHVLSVVQFVISILTFVYLATVPSASLFFTTEKMHHKFVTTDFAPLKTSKRFYSISLWVCVFTAKFLESYFFLTLSLRDSIRILSIMDLRRCHGTRILNNLLCRQQAKVVLALLFIEDLILFFLDTYLWYIICNCIYSITLSFTLGVSVFLPWRNIFVRLPERIASKLLFTHRTDVTDGERVQTERHRYTSILNDFTPMISDVWNAIIVSMYREHILSIDQVHTLIYQTVRSDDMKRTAYIRAPLFFLYQDDTNNKQSPRHFFNPDEESGRRILFFAQSLSSSMPEPIPTVAMPTFTVLIPHYSERILLSLKEIIKENRDSKLSLLDYLKKLHPNDWQNFVQDTKVMVSLLDANDIILNERDDVPTLKSFASDSTRLLIKGKLDDIPLHCFGFKSSSPDQTLRTRIWASSRTQTLYRTVSGFMNYQRAIQLLQHAETNLEAAAGSDGDEFELYLRRLLNRKFKLIVAMQRYQSFSEDEQSDARVLFGTYPEMQVSYIEKEVRDEGPAVYYSCLLDVSNPDGDYKLKYRIRLSGNPILGDGKADNQNHTIPFYRGEYIQVIDSNQDNYIEECLKIKSVLTEFEEYNLEDPYNSDYVPGNPYSTGNAHPVAIVGAREYIFSEQIGVLGDIAASKEQTFGTLFARTLAEIGGKLHYGHPDFLNGIFMTTRGGISKGQKGLHLNEDIFAGMMAMSRGGRIKHCDYYQCGKGRDLGFGTILNFTTKIGAGMGEQILSREHYYLGTQLPLDRFLSFYYAHPGFHLNNLFIMLSVEVFMLILVNLGSLVHETILCSSEHDKVKFTELETPLGCYNLRPVLKWVNRYVLSVVICFFFSFLPLLFQELAEKGVTKALWRICCHFLSLSPLFEVFVCQVYSKSLRDNITFACAKYIPTGRGFATSRIRFAVLYLRYATILIYSGSLIFLKVLFGTLTIWQPCLLWFWITVVSLTLAPFLFNPHQFSWGEFFIDYRDYLRWLSRGNNKVHKNAWVGYSKVARSKFTGYKRKPRQVVEGEVNRPSRWNVFVDQCVVPMLNMTMLIVPYLFINSQNGVRVPTKVDALLRLACMVTLPLLLKAVVVLLLFAMSLFLGPVLHWCCCGKFSGVMAAIAHSMLVLISVLALVVLIFLHSGNLVRVLCGVICIHSIQRFLGSIVSSLVLTRELESDIPNRVWWSGRLIKSGLGFWLTLSQIGREYIVKVVEMDTFAIDFVMGHMLLFAMTPILFVPLADRWHSCMIFWWSPCQWPLGQTVLPKRQRKRRLRIVWVYGCLYFAAMAVFAALITFCVLLSRNYKLVARMVPREVTANPMVRQLIQPNHQNNNDTGDAAPPYILREIPVMAPMKTVL